MNYLAHSLTCLDQPYEVAGAAVPDWLCLTRPRLRCRSRHAHPFAEAHDPQLAAVACGVLRHHADDDWFHLTPAFGQLSTTLSRTIRQVAPDADGLRPGFLGHILVELLLDAEIAAGQPDVLRRYYDALGEVDSTAVAAAVGAMIDHDAAQLAPIIDRFIELRFLEDYPDDDRLVMRLNQVMRRVRLAELPSSFRAILPEARALVAAARDELLTPLASLA